MRIGILGSGLMGGKLGTIFARAGHEVVFSYARNLQKLRTLARDAGGKARQGTPREAAEGAEALLLAVHWLCFDDVLDQAGDLAGKFVVTCSLPMNEQNTELVVGRTSSAAEGVRVFVHVSGSMNVSFASDQTAPSRRGRATGGEVQSTVKLRRTSDGEYQ